VRSLEFNTGTFSWADPESARQFPQDEKNSGVSRQILQPSFMKVSRTFQSDKRQTAKEKFERIIWCEAVQAHDIFYDSEETA
jgi:hypothetical protein